MTAPEDLDQFPPSHFEVEFAPNKITNSHELLVAFEAWFTTGGNDSRLGYCGRCGKYLARPMGKDVNTLLTMSSRTSGIMAWANFQLAEAQEFFQLAVALITQEALDDVKIRGLKDNERKRIVDGRCALYQRALKMFDRVSATATHRGEALRTQIATERVLLEMATFTPRGSAST